MNKYIDKIIIKYALQRIRKLNLNWDEDERANFYGIEQILESEIEPENHICITIKK